MFNIPCSIEEDNLSFTLSRKLQDDSAFVYEHLKEYSVAWGYPWLVVFPGIPSNTQSSLFEWIFAVDEDWNSLFWRDT